MTRSVEPRTLALELTITGDTRTTILTLDSLIAYRTTLTVTPGSSQATFVAAISPDDTWPWIQAAMDRVTFRAAIGIPPFFTPDNFSWRTVWTGYVDKIRLTEDVGQGVKAVIDCSSAYKLLEVTTETPQGRSFRYQDMLASDVLAIAAQETGVSFAVEEGPDSGTLIPLTALDPQGLPGLHAQYTDWATVLASICTMVGRELFADELGMVQYRLSKYDSPAYNLINLDEMLAADLALDSDVGIANLVQIRYGLQELPESIYPIVGPPDNYPLEHYRRRLVIQQVPWILNQADADWYGQWVLSWLVHNTRNGVVVTSFDPTAQIGTVRAFDWPEKSAKLRWYVASVVQDWSIPNGPTTTWGLTYGRDLDKAWFTLDAPSSFLLPHGTPSKAPSQGGNWRITHYDPKGLQTYQDAGGTYLVTSPLDGSQGAKYYQNYWMRPGSGGQIGYSPFRPCAIDPSYIVPELGVSLSAGDVLILQDGSFVEVHDRIGTDAPLLPGAPPGSAAGRQLDVFYWTLPIGPYQDYMNVTYYQVKNANIAPDGGAPGDPATPTSGGPPPPGPKDGGAGLGAFALGQLVNLYKDGTGRFRAAIAGSDLARSKLVPSPFDVECVIFVRYCLVNAGYPNPGGWPDGASTGGVLAAAGWKDMTGYLPHIGDVAWWSSAYGWQPNGTYMSTGSTPGHVAIITAVVPPYDSTQDGSITVAQSNTVITPETFPLRLVGNRYVVLDVQGFGNHWQGIMRYPS